VIIPTQKTLALRCPVCGEMEFYALSRFCIGIRKPARIICRCGTCLLSISRKGRDLYRLQIECVMCESKHIITCKSSELWQDKLFTICCADTGMEIGFIGFKEAVMKSVMRTERSIREMAEELGYDKYFNNAEIMYQVLDLLKIMADEGRMSCSCGSSQLEVEVYPDRIELNCPHCDAVGIVFAESLKELQWLRKVEGIRLDAHTYRDLARGRFHKKTPLKK
jgi:hypothetical protein